MTYLNHRKHASYNDRDRECNTSWTDECVMYCTVLYCTVLCVISISDYDVAI